MNIPLWAQMEIIKKQLAIAEAKKAHREKLESNAEYQRLNAMTDAQRGQLAVDRMTANRLQFERALKGDGISEDQIRRKVLAMQERFERDKKK